MDSARVDDPSDEALRIRYRDHGVWFNTLLMVVILGSRFLRGTAFAVTSTSLIWLIGTALFLISGLLTALRSERGLTLDIDGITWHRAELFIPWRQVTGLDIDTDVKGSGKPRLIVRTATPADALEGQRGRARFLIQANNQQYGGPIAVKAHLLSVPAESVIAAADRLREATAVSGRSVDYARRDRARTIATAWTSAGFAGLLAALATIVVPALF
ncbi:hypothetical protein [Actinomadura latina]|uniref:PH domain-containing protein n=1 Tax=Actinomadura latina TaxID=163603 RepID=A0A846Z2A3_9ACTN|nr:hypothetical protein [Actinomadura latina]NKZ04865.1 hypothetical protein [Actinomadura latina]